MNWGTRLAVLRKRLADERGSIAQLALGYAAIALAAALLLAAAADLYLARKQLFAAADAAALAAVSQLDWSSLTLAEGSPSALIDREAALDAAGDTLALVAPERLGEVAISDAEVVGDTIVLRVHGLWSPAMLSVWVPELVPIEVTVSSRGRLQ